MPPENGSESKGIDELYYLTLLAEWQSKQKNRQELDFSEEEMIQFQNALAHFNKEENQWGPMNEASGGRRIKQETLQEMTEAFEPYIREGISNLEHPVVKKHSQHYSNKKKHEERKTRDWDRMQKKIDEGGYKGDDWAEKQFSYENILNRIEIGDAPGGLIGYVSDIENINREGYLEERAGAYYSNFRQTKENRIDGKMLGGPDTLVLGDKGYVDFDYPIRVNPIGGKITGPAPSFLHELMHTRTKDNSMQISHNNPLWSQEGFNRFVHKPLAEKTMGTAERRPVWENESGLGEPRWEYDESYIPDVQPEMEIRDMFREVFPWRSYGADY